MNLSAQGGQNTTLDTLEQELKAAVSYLMWVLGPKLRSLKELCIFLTTEPSI
jgi:cytochrome c1